MAATIAMTKTARIFFAFLSVTMPRPKFLAPFFDREPLIQFFSTLLIKVAPGDAATTSAKCFKAGVCVCVRARHFISETGPLICNVLHSHESMYRYASDHGVKTTPFSLFRNLTVKNFEYELVCVFVDNKMMR